MMIGVTVGGADLSTARSVKNNYINIVHCGRNYVPTIEEAADYLLKRMMVFFNEEAADMLVKKDYDYGAWYVDVTSGHIVSF